MTGAILTRHGCWRAVALAMLGAALSGDTVQGQYKALQPITVAEKRALLIGNADYEHSGELVNTISDVRELERALREVEFDSVRRLENLSIIEMARALDEFARSLGPGDLAFFYFSGHGLEVEGENYLLPVDFQRNAASDIPYTTLAANRVRSRLEGTGAEVRVLVLDACRNNPFGEGRSDAGGLAKPKVQAKGTLIAYSAAPGQLASDNPGGNLGLYMTYLVPEFRKPRVELQKAFETAQGLVEKASSGKQFPWIEDAIIGEVYLRGGSEVVVPPGPTKNCEGYWEDVRGSEDAGEYEWYLEQCPEGAHSGLAQRRLARLRASRPPAAGESDPRPVARVGSGGREGPEAEGGEWENSMGMEFVWVPAGEFVMGSESEHAYDDERPLTRVRISAGYWLGKHEVTQGEWAAVMGSNPSHFDECGRECPVESVSWEDAQEFVRELNTRERGRGYVYRLPSEAEWEYAARAGTRGDTYAGDLRILGDRNAPVLDGIAWYGGNSGVSYGGGYDCSDWEGKQYSSSRCGPQRVGQKAANGLGLHDMLGNVYEWVQDWYGEYPGGTVRDPTGPSGGSYRVARGCGWYGDAVICRSAARINPGPGNRNSGIGFRLLRTQ